MLNERIIDTELIDNMGISEPSQLYVQFIPNEELSIFMGCMEDRIHMILKSKSFYIDSSNSYRFSDSIFSILKQLPLGFKLRFKHMIEIEKSAVLDIIEAEETVSIDIVTRKKPKINKKFLEDKYLNLPLDAQWFISESNEQYSKGTIPEEIYIKQIKWIQDNIELIKKNEEKSYIPYEELKFTLRCRYLNEVFEADGFEDLSIALVKLVNQLHDIKLKICACCGLSDFMSDGVEDIRHGLFCFKNLNTDLKIIWYERIDWFSKAIRNVDAFHWCDKFISSENCIKKY